MAQEKNGLKIVVVGHVDHGKSTVIGRLLYDTNSLPEGAVDKVKRIAKETGKPFEYAYLLDAFEEEQKQGITIDTTQIQFFTKQREYVIIDAPGHKEFLKNMISGAANAEAALLVIDAKQGVQEQSKRHGYMLSLLGIKKVYVVINKMDLVDYSESVFHSVVAEMKEFLSGLGVYPLKYIPVSAFFGENISQQSDKMPWFKGEPILAAIDLLEPAAGIGNKPLRFPIQDVYKFDDRRIIAGRIEAGTLTVGDEIIICPGGKKTTVQSIEHWSERDKKQTVSAGESTGITVKDEFFNKRGEIITRVGSEPIISNRFRASIFWMGKTDLVLHKKYKLKLATQEVECEVEQIVRVIDATQLHAAEVVDKIILNDVAEVIFKTKEPIAFDVFQQNHVTGRFVVVDGYDVAGGGIVIAGEKISIAEKTPTFFGNELTAHGDIFDEFYYDVDSLEVTKIAGHNNVYTIGDPIKTHGESFDYPEHFDILVFRDQVAIKIRSGKVAALIPFSEYEYEAYPLVNGRGFGIKANSTLDVQDIFKDYAAIDYNNPQVNAKFSNKWFFFNKYRKLTFYFDYII